MLAGVLIVGGTIYNKIYGKSSPATTTTKTTIDGIVTETKTVVFPVATAPESTASAPGQPPAKTGQIPEPFEFKSVHLSGRAVMGQKVIWMFVISQNGLQVSTATDKDLTRMGYRWESLTDCAGTLFWQDTPKAITCDLPQVSMSVASGKSTASAN